jgi:catechol 2,3-dioxygenase-like lactoylglutathione lyase family enzyme
MIRKTSTLTQGIHHAGLTVPDPEKARKYFIGMPGIERAGEQPG